MDSSGVSRFAALFVLTLLAHAAPAFAQAADALNLGTVNGWVRTITVQPDGKILIGGDFTMLGSTPRTRIARLNADGTIDATFNPGLTNADVDAIAVQPDGKIIVGGTFSTLSGASRGAIGRLNPDGSIDAPFDPRAVFSPFPGFTLVRAVAIQADGKIVVGGRFDRLSGNGGPQLPRENIGRINADGTIDPTFNPGAVPYAGGETGVRVIRLQDDGKILVGGDFVSLGGAPRQGLGRLLPAGVPDGFAPGVAQSLDGIFQVWALALQPDGKIVVGGRFDGLGGGDGSGAVRHFIGRVDTNGLVDQAFDPGSDSSVVALGIQADGRIIAGGTFSSFGGGGIGNTARARTARVHGDGTLDVTFDPSTANANQNVVYDLAVQADGRVLLAGGFTAMGGATRDNVARLINTDGAIRTLTTTGGHTITWTRGGVSPEVARVEFSWSADGVTYTSLGQGTYHAPSRSWIATPVGGLPTGVNDRIRARGFYDSGRTWVDQWTPASGTDLVVNGDFGNGMAAWGAFAIPDPTGMTANITGGVFQFYRTGTQAVLLQATGAAIPANTPVTAQFLLGNSDPARKRISILVHDGDFSDLHVCTFWLPGNSPLLPFAIRSRTTEAWTNATISFYAASSGSGGFYQIDDVTFFAPAGDVTETTCLDPTVPIPPGGAAGPNLVTNATFGSGLAGWTLFGQISGSVTGGVFEFVKLTGLPAGVLLQPTTQAMTTNQIVTSTFELGNSSIVRKRVTVILHDNDFSDLAACTFWVPPGQALSTYTLRSFTTKPWANATVSVYPATTGPEQWIRLDDVTLQRTPGAPLTGTMCIEPGGVVPDQARDR